MVLGPLCGVSDRERRGVGARDCEGKKNGGLVSAAASMWKTPSALKRLVDLDLYRLRLGPFLHDDFKHAFLVGRSHRVRIRVLGQFNPRRIDP